MFYNDILKGDVWLIAEYDDVTKSQKQKQWPKKNNSARFTLPNVFSKGIFVKYSIQRSKNHKRFTSVTDIKVQVPTNPFEP